MVQEEKQVLSFFDNINEIETLFDEKEIFIFLDYDGTCTPIVKRPELAVLSDQMRAAIQELARHYKVSVVSGRATDDVRSKVKIDGIFYAGSHGFEIVHPDGKVTVNEKAQKIRKTIDEVHKKLSECLKDVEGALVEHVKYTISTHYRLVSDEDFPKIKEAVEEVLKEHTDLRKTEGKKVFELRPKIDWDKGKAVNFILDVLAFDPQKNLAIYIGDDTTDEDAFRALAGKGFGIRVADEPRPTDAQYVIRNTDKVKDVLSFFIKRATQ